MRPSRLFCLATAIFFGLIASRGHGDDRKPESKPKKATFMEQKVVAANKVLEGLALNDFEKIKENADRLNDLSKLAAWKLIETPRYENYSAEFQRLTLKMSNQAKDRNLEGAALSYVDMTLMCIKCHQHIREVKISQSPGLPDNEGDSRWGNGNGRGE